MIATQRNQRTALLPVQQPAHDAGTVDAPVDIVTECDERVFVFQRDEFDKRLQRRQTAVNVTDSKCSGHVMERFPS